MHIEMITISNYKSFLEKQTLHLEPGFNLLLGTNNAGKTTVLEVINMDLNLNEPHRSERSMQQHGDLNHQPSVFEVTLRTQFSELRRMIGSPQVYLPLKLKFGDMAEAFISEQMLAFLKKDELLRITSIFGSGADSVSVMSGVLVGGVASRHNATHLHAALIQFVPNSQNPQIHTSNYAGNQTEIGNYGQLFRPRIYRFSAQRRPGTRYPAQGTAALDREATNLPFCINHLQSNDAHGHRVLCGWINRIFPSIKWVQAPYKENNFELFCLPQLPEARRDDLATPLSRMGAGIGNVIAMLYVVLTSREPQVIAIDEPNAFLHPRALRELLAILESEGKQHQFILTAHSADVLTAVNTRTISLLDFDGVATTVQQVGPKDLHALRGGLAELGIRMTDLHAKDRVFWVEGQTEELVMPELLRWACPEVAAGTSVLRVERTGTFSKKGLNPEEIAQIYERLSSSSALVPPMVCILLDRENRTAESRESIEKSSLGKLRFLDRKMLENYLLHPGAVAAAIEELEQTTSVDAVREKLCGVLCVPDLASDLSGLDAAQALESVFSDLSDAAIEFRKTRDVPVLVAWILENEPEFLAPLRTCLRRSFGLQDWSER